PRSSWLLPCLEELQLLGCPKLRALPPQLGQQATNLKRLFIRDARCLKTVEDLPFLSGYLRVDGCEGLERVSNLPQVRELFVNECPNLRHVEELGGLEELWLDEGMLEISSLWVPRLLEQHRQLHGDEHELESPVWEHAQAAGWATVWLTKPNLVDKKISGSEQVADEQVVTVADGDMVLSAQPEKEMTAAMLLKSSGHTGSHYPVTGSNEAVAVGLAPHMTPIRRSDRSNSETALGIASADDDSLLKAMKRKAAINLDDQFAPYGARLALLASPQGTPNEPFTSSCSASQLSFCSSLNRIGVSLGNNSAEVDFSIKALKHINVDKLKVIPKANSSFSLNQCRHG
uniref:Uncharacterized protein n=1 Tax=Oryza glaberrima TaxID=4538 RepID=I1R217_ORYGL